MTTLDVFFLFTLLIKIMNKAHDFHGKVGIKFTVSFMVIGENDLRLAELSDKFFWVVRAGKDILIRVVLQTLPTLKPWRSSLMNHISFIVSL